MLNNVQTEHGPFCPYVKAQPNSYYKCKVPTRSDKPTFVERTIHCHVINKRSLFHFEWEIYHFVRLFFPFSPSFCTSWITLLNAIYFSIRRSITLHGVDEGIVTWYLIIKRSSRRASFDLHVLEFESVFLNFILFLIAHFIYSGYNLLYIF